MVESVKTLEQRIDESIRSSKDRIAASGENQRYSDIYISTSRLAIDRSLRQMNQLFAELFGTKREWSSVSN